MMAGVGDIEGDVTNMTTWTCPCLGFPPFSFSFVYFSFFSMVLQHVTGDCDMTDKFERHRAGHGGQGVMVDGHVHGRYGRQGDMLGRHGHARASVCLLFL